MASDNKINNYRECNIYWQKSHQQKLDSLKYSIINTYRVQQFVYHEVYHEISFLPWKKPCFQVSAKKMIIRINSNKQAYQFSRNINLLSHFFEIYLLVDQ